MRKRRSGFAMVVSTKAASKRPMPAVSAVRCPPTHRYAGGCVMPVRSSGRRLGQPGEDLGSASIPSTATRSSSGPSGAALRACAPRPRRPPTDRWPIVTADTVCWFHVLRLLFPAIRNDRSAPPNPRADNRAHDRRTGRSVPAGPIGAMVDRAGQPSRRYIAGVWGQEPRKPSVTSESRQ